MNQKNGNHRGVALAEIVEEEQQPDHSATFFATNDPALRPPKPLHTEKKKGWRRKMIGWGFILLLIGAGVLALYFLLKVNRVDVRVQADSRREDQNVKDKPDAGRSESGLTADAINIARAATDNDNVAVNSANPAASPNASPAPSPSQVDYAARNFSYTGSFSPVTDSLNEARPNDNANQQAAVNRIPTLPNTPSAATTNQSHANTTQTIFVGDTKSAPNAGVVSTQFRSRLESVAPTSPPKAKPAVLPPFGTMLPVRTQGVIFTLRNNSYARFELTRDCGGQGWSLPKGTILVGRTTGNEYDRAFLNVIGYIDPRDNKLVKMTGDVLGSDGAAGIPGKRIGVDRNRLKQTLRKVAASGMQVAGMMAGALTGRGTVLIDGAGYRVFDPISNEARATLGVDERRNFVKVEAGQSAYVMVADLPKPMQAVDAPGEDELDQMTGSLTDREVMELILFGSHDELRAAMPLMTDEQKRLTKRTLAQENDDK